MTFKRILSLIFILSMLAACAPGSLGVTPTATEQKTVAPATATPDSPTPTWSVGDTGLSWARINFDDLVPAGVHIQECWNGMGMDDQGRVYIGFTSTRDDGREDFAVFRYDPASGERLFLGTFLDIAKAAGNLQAGESIPKGHTRMIFLNGKMYMASQSFHDLKQEIDSLPTYRGSHLFTYDIQTGAWDDLAARMPGGVITQHEGIIALNIIPNEHLLVGLAHPSSDLVLFDYTTNQLVKVAPGIPWKLGNPLSREIIVTPGGHIYTYRGTEDASQRNEKHTVWVYDIHTGEMKDTGFEVTNGFWNNQTQTRDGNKIYISTVNGELYGFDVASETFTDLGYELPKTDPRMISYTYTVTLSPDEKYVYYVVSVIGNGMGGGDRDGFDELYAYNIATGEIKFVQQLIPGIYTSADLRDSENIYFAHFGDFNDFWSGHPDLMIIHVTDAP
jgi:hypothetical protein